jgi:small-conductance mechanosensitive channel
MADAEQGREPGAGESQVDEAGSGQGAAGGSQEDAPRTFDAEYVGRLRAENAAHRTRLRELEERIRAFEAAQMSEAERLQKRAEEAERAAQEAARRLRERTIRAEVRLAAQAAGIVDPEAAYRLLDLDQVQLDDDGEPVNIPALIARLVKEKPYLQARPGGGSPAGNPGSGRPAVLSLEDVRRMTPEQINANWEAVQAAISRGS